MRNYKRITALLLVLVMCLAYIPAPAHAATLSELRAVNGTVVLDGTTPGTVTVAITSPSSIGIIAVQGTWSTSEKEGTKYMTLTELGSDEISFSDAMAEATVETGYMFWFDFSANPTAFEKDEKILYATYTVDKDTPAGEYTVIFDSEAIEHENGVDATDVFTFTITVTRESEPACDHEGKTYTYEPNGDDTHKVICACSETVKTSEGCSGGTADCENPAQCQFCRTAYGESLGHRDGDDNNHDCDYCDEKTIEGHTEDTREESASEGNCEEAETFVEVTFCTECGEELERSEPYAKDDPVGHTWGAVSYNWSADYSDCTASRTCQIESCRKEEKEEVTTTSAITTPGSCTVKEVVIYTADFTSAWAVDQEKEVTGEYKHDGSCEECPPAELVAVDATVTLDGKNPGTVTVAISTTGSVGIIAVQGKWDTTEKEKSKYMTLTELGSDEISFSDAMAEATVETGYMFWFDFSANPTVFEKDEKILYATYTVDKDTPAGEYTVTFVPEAIEHENGVDATDVFTFTITVTRESEPACDHEGKTYTYEPNVDDTHKVICACGETVGEAEKHDFNNAEHTCVCGKVEEFTITWTVDGEKVDETKVAFGAAITAPDYDVPEGYTFSGWDVPATMPAENLTLDATLTQDEIPATKNGVYFENGNWYCYENGKMLYNKGLITVSDVNWYNGEDVQTLSGTIYVRSNGILAVNTYYVTNVDNYTGTDVASGDKCIFDANGLMQPKKNGIIEENGTLYYYINNSIAYNMGVVEIEEGKYIYVRSNGIVATGKYWITNVGDSGIVAKQYTFDENGIMQNPEFVKDLKNGVVDGYYYVDGNLAYAAGLIKMTDEAGDYYIYVRSNGALATGKYWPTNVNEYDVQGYLNFGTDGKCYI